MVKNLPTDVGDTKGMSSIPGWRRAWQPTPVSMLGESHRQPGRLGPFYLILDLMGLYSFNKFIKRL